MEPSEVLRRAGLRLVWFDSLGAKCSCIAVGTPCGLIVIDPGAAEMQPSYPLPGEEKRRLRVEAMRAIEEACRKARMIIVTHYHYDHHALPLDDDLRDPKAMWLGGKLLVLKNPNKFINESQWHRARLFLEQLLGLAGMSLHEHLTEPEEAEFADPVEELTSALSRDYGSYQQRRMELLAKGKEWFRKLTGELWSKHKWVKEITLSDGTRVLWGDGRCFTLGDVKVKVFEPWFHGVEYDRTGWVTPVLIEKPGWRIFYSSDLMGPAIEDYAERIAKLKPDVVILDGPPTYLYPYMLNRINLRRAVENAITILSCKPKLVVYDHHLLREKRWRERVEDVFVEAEKQGVQVLTAAECSGREPLIDVISKKGRKQSGAH